MRCRNKKERQHIGPWVYYPPQPPLIRLSLFFPAFLDVFGYGFLIIGLLGVPVANLSRCLLAFTGIGFFLAHVLLYYY